MNAMLDTLAYSKKLRAAGIDSEVADAHAEALRDAIDDRLVTRDYLDTKLADAKTDMIKWVIGLLIAHAGVTIAVIKLL